MIFRASLDKLAVFITTVSLCVFSFLTFFPFQQIEWQIPHFGIALMLFLSLLACWIYHPIKYSITTNELIIHRPINSVFIKKSDIDKVIPLNKADVSWSVRLFGVGGMFGYFGKFYNSKFGKMTWYLSRKDTLILIQIGNKKIVISPDHPKQFVEELNRK